MSLSGMEFGDMPEYYGDNGKNTNEIYDASKSADACHGKMSAKGDHTRSMYDEMRRNREAMASGNSYGSYSRNMGGFSPSAKRKGPVESVVGGTGDFIATTGAVGGSLLTGNLPKAAENLTYWTDAGLQTATLGVYQPPPGTPYADGKSKKQAGGSWDPQTNCDFGPRCSGCNHPKCAGRARAAGAKAGDHEHEMSVFRAVTDCTMQDDAAACRRMEEMKKVRHPPRYGTGIKVRGCPQSQGRCMILPVLNSDPTKAGAREGSPNVDLMCDCDVRKACGCHSFAYDYMSEAKNDSALKSSAKSPTFEVVGPHADGKCKACDKYASKSKGKCPCGSIRLVKK